MNLDSFEQSDESHMDLSEKSDEQNKWNPLQEFEIENEEIKNRRGKVYPRHLTKIEVINKNTFVEPDQLLFGKIIYLLNLIFFLDILDTELKFAYNAEKPKAMTKILIK